MIDGVNAAAEAQAGQVQSTRKWYVRLFDFFENPLAAGAAAFLVYALIGSLVLGGAHKTIFSQSPVAYFNYLADALLHGQIALRFTPPVQTDLSLFQGKYFLYWSPMPAFLLMPFVALFGLGFSDIFFTLVVAGVNVGLVALLFRQATRAGVLSLSKTQRGLLTAFFAFGTVQITLASFGRVWFTGQQVGFCFTLLAYLAAITLDGFPAWLLTGLALSGGLLTRNQLVLVGVWPAVYLLVKSYPKVKIPRLLAMAAVSAAPIVLAVMGLGVYNYLRFGSLMDNGLAYHMMNSNFRSDYDRYGVFNLYYLPINFYYQFVAYPFLNLGNLFSGGSLFLLSPVFLAAFWGILKGKPRWSTAALLLSILLTAVPILLLMGTGWIQFGPRYTLDFTVPLLLLTAMGIPYWKQSVSMLLTLISLTQYVIGTFILGIALMGG